MDFLSNDYSEEERRGVNKYLWHRFIFRIVCLGVMLLLILVIYSCNAISDACMRAEYSGTWVLTEDYSDGFDADDRFIEFRYTENRWGEKELVLFMDGSQKGEVIYKEGRRAVETEDGFYPMASKRDVNIWIIEKNGQITLEYKERKKVDQVWQEKDITETYIRISKDCELTEEQRAALY